MPNRFNHEITEYDMQKRLAEGISSDDLQGALREYYSTLSFFRDLAEITGFIDPPIHVKAYQDILNRRSGITRQLSR